MTLKFPVNKNEPDLLVEPHRIVVRDAPQQLLGLYLITNEFGVCAMVWSKFEDDALDEAADLGLLAGLKTDTPDPEATPLGSYGLTFDLTYCRVRFILVDNLPEGLRRALVLARDNAMDTLTELTLSDLNAYDVRVVFDNR